MDNKEENRKTIVFYIDEDTHARLRIQLRYDRLTQTMFFNFLIKGYLENNKHIRDYMDFIIAERTKIYKRNIKTRKNDRKEESETIEDFALNEEDIKNIFDILERENPDI